MAFGQQSGPPATARQVQHLLSLLQGLGHTDFRDARGALGLTQRQAAGKFTRDEVETLISRLEAEAEAGAAVGSDAAAGRGGAASRPASRPVVDRRDGERAALLQKMPADLLAAELQRRGWIVMEP